MHAGQVRKLTNLSGMNSKSHINSKEGDLFYIKGLINEETDKI